MTTVGEVVVIEPGGLGLLVAALRAEGRTVVGPTVRSGAIVIGELRGLDDLPRGWTHEQDAGRYRLVRRGDAALFGYTVGLQSFKASFFAPREVLLRARRADGSFVVLEEPRAVPRLALLGARACDLAAIGVQDRVLQEGAFVDGDYVARRQDVFVVAVQCGQAGGTCFCVSMGTGPRATRGFDLALTELAPDEDRHRFVVEVGSDAGAALVAKLPHRPATDDDRAAAERAVTRAAAEMGRSMEPEGLREVLQATLEHPRWDEVAARCLACTSCTLVCPTCFCSTTEDTTDLSGELAERARRWDSCFTVGHSWVHGGAVHASIRSRYRQWLTHKLGTWHDQFGTSGCVGCGRCITWCPAGIDLTAEIAALRAPARRKEA